MGDRTIRAALIVYGLIAVMTFGHAFVSIRDDAAARCKTAAWCFPEEPAIYGGVAASAMWPLYWSVQIARAAKEPKP